MATSRAALRAVRTVRPTPQSVAFRARPATRRGYANGAPNTTTAQNPALVGALSGAAAALAVGYGVYSYSGVKTAVNSVSTTKKYFDNGVKKLSDSAPEPSEALEWLRSTALSYSAAIPGAKSYVNTAFDDLDAIQKKHGDEVNKIISELYKEVKDVTQKGGLDVQTAYRVWEILGEKLKQITSLAGDAAEDILDNHPYVKQKVGGSFKQLRQLGEQMGPQAKDEINKTYQQVQDVLKEGFSGSTIPKIQALIQEKSEKLKELGNQAWSKGLEQAKPYFDKNPQLKKLVEENADALKSGNYAELWEKVKSASSSGNMGDLESYVKSAKDKVQQGSSAMGFDLGKYAAMVPGGAEISKHWESLVQVGEKHGDEAKGLLESTVKEIKEVLSKKAEEAKKLADKAQSDAKSKSS